MLKNSKERWKLLGVAAFTALNLVSCGWKEEPPIVMEKEPVILEIGVAQSQWKGAVDTLTEMYLAENPQVDEIRWNLISKRSYWDLMNMKLATGKLPDIMEVGAWEELEAWHSHLLPLDWFETMDGILPGLKEGGEYGEACYTAPVAIYGLGILYNMDLLKEAGWDRIPADRKELLSLCESLEKKGIYSFMNPYHDISSFAENSLLQMVSMKPNPKLYVQLMKKSNQKPIAEDLQWNAMMDFCDLTLLYGNRRPLQLDPDIARNYFYIQKYAMITNESSRSLIDMLEVNPQLPESISIGPFLFSEEEKDNRLLLDVVRLGVTSQCSHPEEAYKFLQWLITDEEALAYEKEFMGALPVTEKGCEKGLTAMAQAVYDSMNNQRTTGDIMGLLPMGLMEETGNCWASYMDGKLSREELFQVYETYWKQYTGQEY